MNFDAKTSPWRSWRLGGSMNRTPTAKNAKQLKTTKTKPQICVLFHPSKNNPYKKLRTTIPKLLVFSERFFRKEIYKSLAYSPFKVPPILVFFSPTDPTDPTDLLDPSDPSDPTDQSEKPIGQITNSRAIPSVEATTL